MRPCLLNCIIHSVQIQETQTALLPGLICFCIIDFFFLPYLIRDSETSHTRQHFRFKCELLPAANVPVSLGESITGCSEVAQTRRQTDNITSSPSLTPSSLTYESFFFFLRTSRTILSKPSNFITAVFFFFGEDYFCFCSSTCEND